MQDDPILWQLQSYGACDVADALLRLGVEDGGFLPGLSLRTGTSDTRLIGRAFTIRFDKKPADGTAVKKSFEGHYIDHVPPDAVLVSSAPPDTNQAILGGLMALRLGKIGALGAVIDGRIRDLAELRQVGLPIFSRDVGISAATAVVYPAELNVEITIRAREGGTTTIQPRQIVVGDENGLAVIPAHLEQQVVDLLPKLVEQDQKVREALEEGQTAVQAFKLRTL